MSKSDSISNSTKSNNISKSTKSNNISKSNKSSINSKSTKSNDVPNPTISRILLSKSNHISNYKQLSSN